MLIATCYSVHCFDAQYFGLLLCRVITIVDWGGYVHPHAHPSFKDVPEIDAVTAEKSKSKIKGRQKGADGHRHVTLTLTLDRSMLSQHA